MPEVKLKVKMPSDSPILYEVNTRVWLRELSESAGRPITLSDVPDAEIEHWKALGFTHIWLMGVWQIGPEARQIALEYWRKEWSREIPSVEADVQGSPFAIQEYAVDSRVGQPLELLMFKERLTRAGLSLILDFVPNHLGIDSPEPRRYPARFVQAPSLVPGTFLCETRFGTRYFAHGRDPYFPPWTDTVQLDYRVVETQDVMASIAQTISMFGNGLRCDMAMLLLPDILLKVWKDFPSLGMHQTTASFWAKAIPKIRQLQPHVDLIAEAYWDREEDLQEAGFDFTYNKRVTDFLLRAHHADLLSFLQNCSPGFLKRSVHFLENHDEPRIASALPFRRHKAAAALILFLPGMALLHDGQLEGRKRFSRIQVVRRPAELTDLEIEKFYRGLLGTLQRTHIRRGTPYLFRPDATSEVLVIRWQGRGGGNDLGVVNLGGNEVEFLLSTEQLGVPASEAKLDIVYSTEPGGAQVISGTRVKIAGESAVICTVSKSEV